jgi:hypothetical protein
MNGPWDYSGSFLWSVTDPYEAERVTLYSNRSRLGMKLIRRRRPVKGGDLLPETFSFVA